MAPRATAESPALRFRHFRVPKPRGRCCREEARRGISWIGGPAAAVVRRRCGIAAGADAVFLEVHPEPARARSDAASQLPLEAAAPLLAQLAKARELYRESEA